MDALVRFSDGAPASALLLAAILVFSALGLFVRPALIERNLLRPHGLTQRGDYYTLVTSGFIHADLAHLLLNCFTLWAFGFGLERALGTPSFVVLYAFGLLSSSIATWLVHRRRTRLREPGRVGRDPRGAVRFDRRLPTSSIFILPLPVPIPAPLFAVGFLAYSVIASRARIGRVNHDAHIAGAIAGGGVHGGHAARLAAAGVRHLARLGGGDEHGEADACGEKHQHDADARQEAGAFVAILKSRFRELAHATTIGPAFVSRSGRSHENRRAATCCTPTFKPAGGAKRPFRPTPSPRQDDRHDRTTVLDAQRFLHEHVGPVDVLEPVAGRRRGQQVRADSGIRCELMAMPRAAAMPAACIQPLTPPMRATSGMTRSQARPAAPAPGPRAVEVLADLQRQVERLGDLGVAAKIVVADRLFQPGHALGLQRATARQGVVDDKRLVVVDHQLDVVGQARAHGARHGQVLVPAWRSRAAA